MRFGLHSHGQYALWKDGFVWGDGPGAQEKERTAKDLDGNICDLASVIPADLYSQNVAELLDIVGFSGYTDTPSDINSAATFNATFDRLRQTLDQAQTFAQKFGRYESGPFTGQWKKQTAAIEYGVAYKQEDEAQVAAEGVYLEAIMAVCKGYQNMLGMLWWEPVYRNNNWGGGEEVLFRFVNGVADALAPSEALRVWGAQAVSPWL